MTQPHAIPRFIGRDDELRELLEMLAETAAGRGRLVLVGGEPGIGKSRLADELASHAREGGHLVLWGSGWEDAGAPPYWPWVQALRAHLRSTDDVDLRRQLGSGAADIAQMLPELRDRFPDITRSPAFETDSARFQLFDSAATFLGRVARERPLLIVLDDLHAADTPSILLLRFVATQLADIPLLLAGTYREVELTPDHPLTVALAEIARERVTLSIHLEGLSADAVGEYLRASTRRSPDRIARAIWRATGGNPLFVGEAVRLLSAEARLDDIDDLPSVRLAVPASVRAAIGRRIGYLGQHTRTTLRLGAVLGPEFSVAVLCEIAPYSADETLESVDDAVQAGLLLPVAGATGRYRFAHDLVRETLYDDLSPSRRMKLHRQIAATLEDVYASSIDERLAELAYHHVQAIEQGGALLADDADGFGARGMDYARRAGDVAARSLAYEEAARLYRMALAVIDLAGIDDDAARTEILLAQGEAQTRAGDLDGAGITFLAASEIARRAGAGSQLSRAALGFGGRLPWARPGNDTRLIPLLQDALVMLGGADDRLRVRLLTRLACAWRSAPERRRDSDALSRQAVQIARALDDAASLAYALTGRFWATWWPENPTEREAIADELARVAEALGDPERICDARVMRFASRTERGQITEARFEIAALTRVVDELRQPAQLWLEPTVRAYLALLLGEYSAAEKHIARELRDDHRVMPARDDVSSVRMHLFLLHRELGRLAEQESAVRDSVAEFPWYPLHRSALACLLLDLGREVEAREVFQAFAKNEFSAFYRDNEWLLGIALASEACARLGDALAAGILYEQLAPFHGRHAIGHAEGSVGAVDRYLGLLASTQNELDKAIRHLGDGIELNEKMGAVPWSAHTQHDLAQVLRRRDAPGDLARAASLDRLAKSTADRLGMSLAERIDIQLEVPTQYKTSAAQTTVTFRREGEYWSVDFGQGPFRVRDSKGLRYISHLLRMAGREIHALDLAREEASAGARTALVEAGVLSVGGIGDAGPILDAEAKAAYRRRLDEIGVDRSEAERWNDVERVARLDAEQEALIDQLSGAFGMGGRNRLAASAAERARLSVTRAIRSALRRIAAQDAALGDHLAATIRTGTFCSYHPDPRLPITWLL